MPKIVKCTHCYYLDYLDEEPERCPECGSATQKVENPFENEVIKVKITNTRRQKHKIDITFSEVSKVVGNMMNAPLKEAVPDNSVRSRIAFMIKAYTWSMLKIQPQLWIDISTVVNGIRELMTLRIKKGG